MDIDERYYPYSKYLKKRYGEKVYKLPVNLPVTCPNRISGAGCSFCAETGTGFEAMDSAVSVTEQLMSTRKYIEKRYHAHKLIFKIIPTHLCLWIFFKNICSKHRRFLIS